MTAARDIPKHCRTDTVNAMAKARGLMQTLLATTTQNMSKSIVSLGNLMLLFTPTVRSRYV
jgi:hypothetical protein